MLESKLHWMAGGRAILGSNLHQLLSNTVSSNTIRTVKGDWASLDRRMLYLLT